MLTPENVRIETLGERQIPSPLKLSTVVGDGVVNFVPDEARMPACVEVMSTPDEQAPVFFEKANHLA